MELVRRALPGLIIAGAIIWFTYLLSTLNDAEPRPESRPDPAVDRYLLKASELRLELFDRTYEDQLEILTLENQGWGLSYPEARNEAIAELDDERSYLKITVNDYRVAVGEVPEVSP